MAAYSIDDPKHWLAKADEGRAMADQLTDPKSKLIMMEIVRAYAQLAQITGARDGAKGEGGD